MATTLKILGQSALSTSSADVYTVPASITAIVKEIIFCNTSANPVAITMYFTQGADAAQVKNTILKSVNLLPYETQFYGLSSFLPAGAKIKALATVASVVGMTISGVEM